MATPTGSRSSGGAVRLELGAVGGARDHRGEAADRRWRAGRPPGRRRLRRQPAARSGRHAGGLREEPPDRAAADGSVSATEMPCPRKPHDDPLLMRFRGCRDGNPRDRLEFPREVIQTARRFVECVTSLLSGREACAASIDLIRTRTAEGRSRAKARGQHMGRPSKLANAQKAKARRRRAEGATLKELARSYDVRPCDDFEAHGMTSLGGQWIGRYTGSNAGRFVIELDEAGDHYEGTAVAWDDNPVTAHPPF